VPWYETIWVQLGLVGFLCNSFPFSMHYLANTSFDSSFAKAFSSWAALEPILVNSGSSRYSESGFPNWLPLSGYTAYGSLCMVYLPSRSPLHSYWLQSWHLIAYLGRIGLENKYWSLKRRLHYSLITLAALAFIPFLAYWNLLGFQF